MEEQDLRPFLVESSAVGNDTQAKLQAWEYTYTHVPRPRDTGPIFNARIVPTRYVDLTPGELSQVEVYRDCIGRMFVDTESGVHYQVTSVCRNETFSELFFRYVRVGDGSGVESEAHPEFSTCSEMMEKVSWAAWLPIPASEEGGNADAKGSLAVGEECVQGEEESEGNRIAPTGEGSPTKYCSVAASATGDNSGAETAEGDKAPDEKGVSPNECGNADNIQPTAVGDDLQPWS